MKCRPVFKQNQVLHFGKTKRKCNIQEMKAAGRPLQGWPVRYSLAYLLPMGLSSSEEAYVFERWESDRHENCLVRPIKESFVELTKYHKSLQLSCKALKIVMWWGLPTPYSSSPHQISIHDFQKRPLRGIDFLVALQ